MFLSACSTPVAPTPQALPAATIVPFTPISGLPDTGQVTTLGYLLVSESGIVLADSVSFAGNQPRALGSPADTIWCGDLATIQLTGALSGSGAVRTAIVIAQGNLSGPGAYGPSNLQRRQLSDARMTVMVPEETSVINLQEQASYYEGRVVRVNGGIITRDQSAVLVDQLGTGGVPKPAARQIKLRWRADDTALLTRLHSAPNGNVHFGQVQVEGYWRNNVLVVLAIRALSA